jgi:hypothetical protein
MNSPALCTNIKGGLFEAAVGLIGWCIVVLWLAGWAIVKAAEPPRLRPKEGETVRSELLIAINKAFKQADIQIPLPQQDVHVHWTDKGATVDETKNHVGHIWRHI